MGCRQCSHLLGPDNPNGDNSDPSGSLDYGDDVGSNGGRGRAHGNGGRRGARNYSSGDAPHGNNLTDISEESSSACRTSQ